MTKVKLVQLHDNLFLAGSDLGKKLIPQHSKGKVGLFFDKETDHVIVEYKNERAHIKNWASFNEDINHMPEVVTAIHHAQVLNISHAQAADPKGVFTAQVSTPMDKVHQTAPLKPGKKAKFQGEQQGE